MSRILFENKKAALGFAGAIVVGAMVFSGVSGSSDDGADRRDSRFGQSAEAAVEAGGSSNKAREVSEEEEEDNEIAFAEDEELVDNADGFDPTPGGSDELEEGDEPEPDYYDEPKNDEDDDGDRRSSRRNPYAGFDDFDDEDGDISSSNLF